MLQCYVKHSQRHRTVNLENKVEFSNSICYHHYWLTFSRKESCCKLNDTSKCQHPLFWLGRCWSRIQSLSLCLCCNLFFHPKKRYKAHHISVLLDFLFFIAYKHKYFEYLGLGCCFYVMNLSTWCNKCANGDGFDCFATELGLVFHFNHCSFFISSD